MIDLRLAPAALGAWVAAAVAVGAAPEHVVVGALASGAVLASVLLVVVVRASRAVRAGTAVEVGAPHGVTVRPPLGRPVRTVVGQALLVVAGVTAVLLSCAGQLAARSAAGIEDLAADGATARVTATVRSAVEPRTNPWTGAQDRHEVRVEATVVTARGVTTPAAGPLVVAGPGGGWDELAYGATVESVGRLAADGDRTFLRVDEAPAVVEPPSALLRAVHVMRTGLLDVTDRLSPQARGLVPGVAVGDTSRLPADLDEALRTTSLTHDTAVSGGHFAIIVTCVAALCVAARAPRVVRVLVTATATVGFVALVHPEPSVLRAAAMGGVGLVGILLGRPSRAVAALGAAVVVLLVLDPWLARSYGFVLSVAATAGLALGTAPLARRIAPWCGRTVAHVVAVPLAAQVACAPIVVLLDPSVSLYAVPANVLAAPALGPATVLGVLATLLAPVWPGGAGVLAGLAGVFTGWIAGVAETFAALPAARLPWPGGTGGLFLLAAVTALALVGVLRSRALLRAGERRELDRALRRPARTRSGRWPSGRWPSRRSSSGRGPSAGRAAGPWTSRRSGPGPSWPGLWRGLAVAGAAGALVVVVLLGRQVATSAGGIPDDWTVVACDVGQGDALVVRSGASSAVVIDVGPPGTDADRCLDDLGVDRVELLVLSHFHADHVGGLEDVLRGRDVDRALVTGTRDPAAQADRALSLLDDAGVAVQVAQGGDTGSAGAAGGPWAVAWDVLQAGPPAPTGAGEPGGANDASVALLVQVRGLSVVALGDLEDPGQESLARLLEVRRLAAVDVVKMAHHGSRTQSDRLAAVLSPRVAIVSSGENTYGHPTDHALDLYRGVGATVLRTDTCGTFALVVRDAVLGAVGCG